MKTAMREIVDDHLYLASDGSQLMREDNTLTPGGNPMNGRWVLRDVNGVFIDYDKYRNDLAERFNLDLWSSHD